MRIFSPDQPFPEKLHGVDVAYSLRNKCSSLCHQVVTACDSGRTLEEGLQTYREHQQAKVDELQVSQCVGRLTFCDVLNDRARNS